MWSNEGDLWPGSYDVDTDQDVKGNNNLRPYHS